MFSWIKKLVGIEDVNDPVIMKQGALIVDVRTEREYLQGHLKESINIPLSEISKRVDQLKQTNKPETKKEVSKIPFKKTFSYIRYYFILMLIKLLEINK